MGEFERFMEASRLTEFDVAAFTARIEQFVEPVVGLSIFDQAGPEFELPEVEDRLQQLFEARRSGRRFGSDPVTTSEIAALLAAAGAVDGRPVVAAAGGLDPLGLYALVVHSDGPLHGKILRYQPSTHTVGIVAPVPEASRIRSLFSLDCDGTPQVLLVYLVDPAATIAKYGERGGRFLLQHVGLAMANVGLRLAAADGSRRRSKRLHGYILGGVLDEVAECLHLAHTRARVVGAYAVGR